MTFDVIVSDIHVIVLQESKAMFQTLVFESHHLVIISIRKALIARKKKKTISGILHMNLSLTISQVFGMNDITGNCFLSFLPQIKAYSSNNQGERSKS